MGAASFHVSLLGFLVALLFIQGLEAVSCPKNWFLFEQHCYGFFKEKLSWNDAETECTSYGNYAHLASILNKRDMAIVSSAILTGYSEKFKIWIGLYKLEAGRKRFRWLDAALVAYTPWDPSQRPSTGMDCAQLSSQELRCITKWAPFLAVFLAAVALSLFSMLMICLNIYIKKADTLNDQTLQMRMQENRLNDAIKLLAGDQGQHCKICSNYTWLQRGENCYRLTDLLMPWGRCMGKCQKRGGGLLKAETQGEMEFLLQESRKWVRVIDHVHVPQKVWIGLLFNLSQTTWCWADGEILHMQISIHVSAPCPGECCVAIHNGKAITNPCSEENRCLCKKVVL
ncbi:killer cell lectin-like receptor subfamily B member 1B allele B [Erythrolamprus reginae]|uniref:killer cell lectin-like receptor subfamily B member 1B allele B n=1 Tax=Erythrolamprus reginae TaxID=121349 RepID=UPI00396CB139